MAETWVGFSTRPAVAFQKIFAGATDMARPFQLLAAFNGAALAVTLYACVRAWGGGRLTAAAAVALGASFGSFVFWAATPEQHVLAGLTVLGVFLVARLSVADPVGRALQSAVMFGLAYSMTVTNVAAWVLARTSYADLFSGRVRAFLTENIRRLPEHVLAILGGLGLVAIGMAITWYGLYNRLMGRLLDIFRETKYLTPGAEAFGGGLHALGLVSPDLPLGWGVNLLGAAALAWAVWRLRKGPVFIPLFALFGVLLHSSYQRPIAFLFSPEYGPAAAAGLALLAQELRPRAGPVTLLAVAVALAAGNLAVHHKAVKLVAGRTLPLSSYGLVQPAPRVIPPIPPGILRP